jgi:transcriptional regulator with XRE-family HTH domain
MTIQTCLYTVEVMTRKMISKSLDPDVETFGQRLARLRKERGFTQVEIAERVGIIQALVSDYELDKLRLNAEMVVRFATALEISTDELLKPQGSKAPLRRKPSLRMLRRLEKIESLPASQQSTLLKTIDTFLRGAVASR